MVVALKAEILDMDIHPWFKVLEQHPDDLVAGDAGRLGAESGENAVAEDGGSHRNDVGGGAMEAPLEDGSGLGGGNEVDAGPRARSPSHHFADELRSIGLFWAGGAREGRRVFDHVIGDGNAADDLLEFQDIVGAERNLDLGLVVAGNLTDDAGFLLCGWIIDDDGEHEAVELSLGGG